MANSYVIIIALYLCAGALVCWKMNWYEGVLPDMDLSDHGDTKLFLKTVLWFFFITIFWLLALVLALVVICLFCAVMAVIDDDLGGLESDDG